MEMNKKKLEQDIEKLCEQFIEIFNELRDKGVITCEEYEEHTLLKRKFLKKIR